MKNNKIMTVFVIVSTLVLMACNVNDDGVPAKSVRNEFRAMYPDARDVEWEREGNYWSVSFEIGKRPDEVDCDALYDSDGAWVMTETDVLLVDVPADIKGYLAESAKYGALPFADREVEYYQTPAGNFYRIELNSEGREIEVDVTVDGKVMPARYNLF